MLPGLAWLLLSYNWRYAWGLIEMRPWRLLTAIYSLPLLISALLVFSVDESPKFLMTKGNKTEALEILKKIYKVNTGKPKETFCVSRLVSSYIFYILFYSILVYLLVCFTKLFWTKLIYFTKDFVYIWACLTTLPGGNCEKNPIPPPPSPYSLRGSQCAHPWRQPIKMLLHHNH